jgi:hypothetical protein
LTRATGNKRLELRRNGEDARAQPFFTLPLDIGRLRNNGAGGNGTNVRFDDFVFEILVDHVVTFNHNRVAILEGKGQLEPDKEVPLRLRLEDRANNRVMGQQITFTVVDKAGAQSDATQIRLRPAGGGAPALTQTVATNAEGRASMLVTRIPAGANGANPRGVISRIRIDIPIVATGGAATGAQFPQEFTIPVSQGAPVKPP